MKRICLLLCLCLVLTGCSGLGEGSYVSVTPHPIQNGSGGAQNLSVTDYGSLVRALISIIASGTENGLIYVSDYNQSAVTRDMELAVKHTMANDPVCVYAVESISFEVGTNAGQAAVAVTIRYVHGRTELQKIVQATNMDAVVRKMGEQLDKCSAGIVLYVDKYEAMDVDQWVKDYADRHPEKVIECPNVTVNLFPEAGVSRVMEIKFEYQNSRDNLRLMQEQISPLFSAAQIYVSGAGTSAEKYAQMYTFLVERFGAYKLETSITPSYSLLLHGVGDSKAFATVYAAMCRKAGLECMVVTGTRDAQPWYWNIIQDGDTFYHIDLVRCESEDTYQVLLDEQMLGYVWDYSAYPACVQPEPEDPDATESAE